MPTASAGFDDGGGVRGRDALAQRGPTLLVLGGFDASFRLDSDQVPRLAEAQVQALVDTGAIGTCIDSALAAQLGLPVVNRTYIAGVGGVIEVNVHLAQIYVPSLDRIHIGTFPGVHLSGSGQPHAVLIGRDFLRHYTMTYEGRTGAVTISND